MGMKLWRVYFWGLAIFRFFSLWSFLKKPSLLFAIENLTSIIILIALDGFCYNRKTWSREFWKVVFFFCPFFQFLCNALTIQAHSTAQSFMFFALSYFFLALFVAPSYIAMYKYAFKRNDVWGKIDKRYV